MQDVNNGIELYDQSSDPMNKFLGYGIGILILIYVTFHVKERARIILLTQQKIILGRGKWY